jgi:hypothetical protein
VTLELPASDVDALLTVPASTLAGGVVMLFDVVEPAATWLDVGEADVAASLRAPPAHALVSSAKIHEPCFIRTLSAYDVSGACGV